MLHNLLQNPRWLFLIDGFGAGLTLFFLLAILLPFEKQFGMPSSILLILAIPASVFATYSICCFLFVDTHWRLFMKAISVANLLYCCVTAILVVMNFTQLTGLGIAYFMLEIGIICVLISLERRAIAQID